MTPLDHEIARTRRGLAELLRRAGTTDSDALREAAKTLASTLEKLEVSAEELEAANTQLAATRAELERSHERYRDLFERAPEPFVVTYLEGTVRDANRSAARLFGTTLDQLIGSPLARWFPLDQRPALRTVLGASSGGRSVRGIELTVDDGPDARVVQASVERATSPDGDPEIRWVLADGTASVVARHRLAELLLSSEQERDELRTTSAWQATLLGAAADDLITPLTVIGTALDALMERGGELDAVQRHELLLRASDHTMQLRRLVPSLLELSQLQLRNGAARRTPVSVAKVVDQALRRLDPTEHTIVLSLGAEDVVADPLELERIVENLIGNAIREAPAGTTITVATTASLDASDVVLSVEDEGPGVPPELREAVFHPFVRTDGARTDSEAGLGLTVVAMFAAMHGGRAWVEEAPSGGARFCVLLANAVD